MALKQQLQATLHAFVLLLTTVMPLATAQSLQLIYHGRSRSGASAQPGDNRINLECRRDGFAVLSPQIWVERSGLPRQQVTTVDHRSGQITIEITQDLEGLYSCSDNGRDRSNRLDFVAYPRANLLIPSSYAFQAGQPATMNCRVMPGRLSQYYRVTWWNGSSTIARSNPHSELLRDVLPGYQLHDNFSLTISDVQLSDSSMSYRCSVTIDDPRIPGTNSDFFYDRDQLGNITVVVYDPPSIVIPLEPRVITLVRGGHPNTTFICEATRVPACTPRISWIHNGRNTSESTDQRFQAYITNISGRTVRSRLNATQLRGRDSGRIDCVASCTVVVPNVRRPLVLTTFRNTTLSVLTTPLSPLTATSEGISSPGEFETVVTLTTDGDMLIRINFQDGYRILDQTRLLMKYTDERSMDSRNMTSEEAYMNTSRILLEVPRSRLPYERFRVDVALQVGDEVGPFVSDDEVHDITQRRTIIIVGTVVGGVVFVAVLIALLICIIVIYKYYNKKLTEQREQVEIQEIGKTVRDVGKTVREMIKKGMSDEERKDYLEFLKENVNYVKEKATSRMATDGDDEKQIFKEFLNEMQIPHSVTNV